jgi:glycosyltransferase involved in cell wall biosynthesis
MARLAWFSPMPPVRSGVASYSAEVVGRLRQHHDIDVYVDSSADSSHGQLDRAAADAPRSAHDFVWRHHRHPYDLTVYQLGNSSHHDFLWPHLFRYPGLVVLHDAHLHHARAAALLRTKRAAAYRAEFAANHPDVTVDLAELAVAGFDTHLLYDAPMTRLVVDASRVTAVHASGMIPSLREQSPAALIESIQLGHGDLVSSARRSEARARIRHQLDIPSESPLFAVFGGLSPEKRIPQVLEAFAATCRYLPESRLLLAGAPASHYDAAGDIARLGLAGRVVVTGYIESDRDLTDHLAACDVALNLRWPTAREVSGPWLRALAAGIPTITTDLSHLAGVPSLDPRTWSRTGCAVPTSCDASEAVTVAVDILDEDHSLRLAMRRLGSDAALREKLSTAGQKYWQREHSHERMMEDYRRVIARALDTQVTRTAVAPTTAPVPAHLTDSAGAVLDALLAPFAFAPGDPRLLG